MPKASVARYSAWLLYGTNRHKKSDNLNLIILQGRKISCLKKLVQQPVSNANNVARIYFREQGEQMQA